MEDEENPVDYCIFSDGVFWTVACYIKKKDEELTQEEKNRIIK
jgi:hypothetical protein